MENKRRVYRLAIVGLGYVGLPLAHLFVTNGHTVYGIDINEEKIQTLLRGESYLIDLKDEDVQQMVLQGNFHPGSGFEAIRHADAVIVCVPTPLDEESKPDLSFVLHAMESVVAHITGGQLVVLESSTYPRTTEDILLPMIQERGMQVGRDVYLAYSPERIDPGRKGILLSEIPKVIGGVTVACSDRAADIYGTVFHRVVPVSSPRVAEMTKLLENSQRFVNISFMNEFAMFCEQLEVDVWEVIEAASSKPYGFTPYYPGPGIGGECIPVDPLYLLWKAKSCGSMLRFLELAKQINDEMPGHIVKKLQNHIGTQGGLTGKHVLIVGLTYKKNVNDMRNSSAVPIIQQLVALGAVVDFYDPYVTEIEVSGQKLRRTMLSESQVGVYDCVLVLTDHDGVDYDMLVQDAQLIIDTRNATHAYAYRQTSRDRGDVR